MFTNFLSRTVPMNAMLTPQRFQPQLLMMFPQRFVRRTLRLNRKVQKARTERSLKESSFNKNEGKSIIN